MTEQSREYGNYGKEDKPVIGSQCWFYDMGCDSILHGRVVAVHTTQHVIEQDLGIVTKQEVTLDIRCGSDCYESIPSAVAAATAAHALAKTRTWLQQEADRVGAKAQYLGVTASRWQDVEVADEEME